MAASVFACAGLVASHSRPLTPLLVGRYVTALTRDPCHSFRHIRFGSGSPARKSMPRQPRPRVWRYGRPRRSLTVRPRLSKLLPSKLRGEQQRPLSRHGCWDRNEQRPKKGNRVAGELKLLLSATSTHSECMLSVALRPLFILYK